MVLVMKAFSENVPIKIMIQAWGKVRPYVLNGLLPKRSKNQTLDMKLIFLWPLESPPYKSILFIPP